jgi:hypothetical protein
MSVYPDGAGINPRDVPDHRRNGPDPLLLRHPPHNLEAEQGVLGSILLDNDVLHDVVGLITADDFYRASHQVLYRAILDMHARGVPIDAITLVDDLSRRDQLQAIGGHEAISQVLDSVPHAANARYYAGIVREKAFGRRLIDAANEILHDGYSNTFTAEQMLESAAGKIEGIVRAAHATAGSSIVWAEDVVEREIEWLWPGFVPRRKQCVVAGPGGIGKSFALCDITARVSAGLEWPYSGGAKAPIGNVLYISGEDDPDDTLRPRLRLQGADLKKVAFLTAETLETFTMACKAKLDKALADMGGECSLVIFDPPSAFLDDVDENSNAEVRGVLRPLKEWAHAHDCGMIFNAHVNKAMGKGLDAQMRIIGSVAWVNAPRVAHMVTQDPEDLEQALLIPLKTNIDRKLKALSFRIVVEEDAERKRPRLVWTGERDVSAKDALEPERKEPVTKKEKIEKWLIAKFRERPARPSADLCALLKAELGYDVDSTFEEVRKALSIAARRNGKSWENYVTEDWIFSNLPVGNEHRESGS